MIRTRHSATYLYPGLLFAEDISRPLPEPTLAAAVEVAPEEDGGYFTKDGWYALRIHTITERRFVADNGAETWQVESRQQVLSAVVGQKVHADEIEDTDRNRILISNIRVNSKDGFGVHTRAGNWQIADDYDRVLSPAEVSA